MTNATAQTPATRRAHAADELAARYASAGDAYPTGTVAAEIRALASLGRTDRWRATVERWATMVEADGTQWALVQGMIYAMHAA